MFADIGLDIAKTLNGEDHSWTRQWIERGTDPVKFFLKENKLAVKHKSLRQGAQEEKNDRRNSEGTLQQKEIKENRQTDSHRQSEPLSFPWARAIHDFDRSGAPDATC